MITYDNKIIIKSMTNNEYSYMATILNDYEYYLSHTKSSLLNHILGVFTCSNSDIIVNKQSYFIQRNL